MTKKSKETRSTKTKKIYSTDDIDVNNILVSKKESYCKKTFLKYFIGYNDNDVIRPLCIRLPQITGYAGKFDENATMSFIVKDKKLLKKYIKIWETIEGLMKISFESKPVYGDSDKYIKTKIKTYAGSIITSFHNKKMPKEKVPCKCLSIIVIDSVIKANKKCYPQTFLEEYKYMQEKIKIENYINEDLENSDSDSDSDSDSHNEAESDIDNEEQSTKVF